MRLSPACEDNTTPEGITTTTTRNARKAGDTRPLCSTLRAYDEDASRGTNSPSRPSMCSTPEGITTPPTCRQCSASTPPASAQRLKASRRRRRPAGSLNGRPCGRAQRLKASRRRRLTIQHAASGIPRECSTPEDITTMTTAYEHGVEHARHLCSTPEGITTTTTRSPPRSLESPGSAQRLKASRRHDAKPSGAAAALAMCSTLKASRR